MKMKFVFAEGDTVFPFAIKDVKQALSTGYFKHPITNVLTNQLENVKIKFCLSEFGKTLFG